MVTSRGFHWTIFCADLHGRSCADFTGQLSVRIYVEYSRWGFPWRLICEDLPGRLVVRLYMAVYLCGVHCRALVLRVIVS